MNSHTHFYPNYSLQFDRRPFDILFPFVIAFKNVMPHRWKIEQCIQWHKRALVTASRHVQYFTNVKNAFSFRQIPFRVQFQGKSNSSNGFEWGKIAMNRPLFFFYSSIKKVYSFFITGWTIFVINNKTVKSGKLTRSFFEFAKGCLSLLSYFAVLNLAPNAASVKA